MFPYEGELLGFYVSFQTHKARLEAESLLFIFPKLVPWIVQG
jgi:hypothetical protein